MGAASTANAVDAANERILSSTLLLQPTRASEMGTTAIILGTTLLATLCSCLF